MPLGSFRFLSKIRGDNREWMLFNDTSDKREKFSGIIFVVDTAEKFIGGVVDTGKQFFGGVVDTGDKF
jgi:hypothetical protein